MKGIDFHAWATENVLTIPEAAEYLKMTRQALHHAVKTGRLRAIREKLILKSDLDEYDRVTVHSRPRSGEQKEPA